MPFGMKKPEWLGYPTVKKFGRYVCFDRQTGGQTPHDGIGHIALRGNKRRTVIKIN